LLNSEEVQNRIEKSPYLKALIASAKDNHTKLVNGTYLFLLSRYPTKDEMNAANQYMATSGLTIKQSVADLAWALINGKEFLYRH
jgi:hypothetical protein